MLKSLDVFPKAYNSELKVKTKLGGLLTIASLLFLLVNIYFEVKNFSCVQTKNILSVAKMPLPKTFAFSAEFNVFNDCNNLHTDVTNQKRTFTIDAQYESVLRPKDGMCNIKVTGRLPTIPGSFHIGLGENFEKNGTHSHFDILLQNTNLSHQIKSFNVGDFVLESAINQTELIFNKDKRYMIIYQLQFVPVLSKTQKIGYQILADVTKRDISLQRSKGISGIIFDWDFSPLQLSEATERKPIIYLVSHILALFGSFFVFTRWIDAFAFRCERRFMYSKL